MPPTFHKKFFIKCTKGGQFARFSLNNICEDGRFDLICRVINASLFTDQGTRRDTQAVFALLGSATPEEVDQVTLLTVCGECVRHLRPDERNTAAILQRVLRAQPSLQDGAVADAVMESRESKSAKGVFVTRYPRSAMPLVQLVHAAVDAKSCGCGCGGEHGGQGQSLAIDTGGSDSRTRTPPTRVAVVMDRDGIPVDEWCSSMVSTYRGSTDCIQLMVVLGDNVGLSAGDQEDLEGVHRVSVGEQMLLTSHTIVILHHWLDRLEALLKV